MQCLSSKRGKLLSKQAYLWLLLALLSGLLFAACDCNGFNNSCTNTTTTNTTTNNTLPGTSNSAPSGSSAPAPLPTSTPSPTPSPTPVPPIYKADWSSGTDGWVLSGDWSAANGILINDGLDYDNDGHPTATAPDTLQDVADYSVQMDIRLDRYTDEGGISGLAGFGLVVRWSQEQVGGYKLGVCASAGIYSCGRIAGDTILLSSSSFFQDDTPLWQAAFKPGEGVWHTYRIDVQENTITAWLDGGELFHVTADTFPSAGNVGLWSYRSQISVRNFIMKAL